MAGMELDGADALTNEMGNVVENWGQPVSDREVTNSVDHAAPVEFGAVIEPTNAEYLHFWVDGEEVFTKGPIVQDPQPYFRPAVDDTGAEMARIAQQADSLDDFVERTSLYFHTEAAQRTPRDTGELQAGWTRP